MKKILLSIAVVLVSNVALAGLCTGSVGCQSIYCNNSVECKSAGCDACTSGQNTAPQWIPFSETDTNFTGTVASNGARCALLQSSDFSPLPLRN